MTEFEIVYDDDERLELCDRRLPIAVRRVKSWRASKRFVMHEFCMLIMFFQDTATALPTLCDIFGVATDAGLVIVDSGTTEFVGSPEAPQSVLSAIQRVQPHAKVEIDVEAGGAMTVELADGTLTSASSLVWMQPPHGCFSLYVSGSTGVPMLLSIKGIRAMQATIDFSTNTM